MTCHQHRWRAFPANKGLQCVNSIPPARAGTSAPLCRSKIPNLHSEKSSFHVLEKGGDMRGDRSILPPELELGKRRDAGLLCLIITKVPNPLRYNACRRTMQG